MFIYRDPEESAAQQADDWQQPGQWTATAPDQHWGDQEGRAGEEFAATGETYEGYNEGNEEWAGGDW